MLPVIAKNTIAQLVSRAFFILFSFLLIRLLTGFLGKEGYGAYGFITATVLLFGTLADWGINIIAVREASKDPPGGRAGREKQNQIFGTVLIARLFLALFSFILINIVVRVYSPWREFITPMTIASLVLLFLSFKTSLGVIFQTLLRLDQVAVIEAAGSILFFLLTALLLTQGVGLNGVLTAWVVGTLFAAALAWFLAQRLTKVPLALNIPILQKLLWESLPMGALLLVFSIYNRVDIIILEHFWGVGDVGIYNLAYKIHENLILGAAFLMNAAFPVISRIYKDDKKEDLRTLYEKIFGLLGLVGLVVAAGFWLGAPTVVNILTGNQYFQFADSISGLRILVFATFISYFNHLTGYSLIAFGKQRVSLVIGVFALFFNVAANIIFIPLYSWRASAVVTVMTELLVFAASSVVVWRILKVYPSPFLIFNTLREIILRRGKL